MHKSYYFLIAVIMFSGCTPQPESTIFVEPHCLPSQSQCKITNSFGSFDILFNVDTVITEQMFDIIIKKDSAFEKLKVTGYLEGKEMFMGKIPLFFEKYDLQTSVSKAMLGSCTEQDMTWRMWLTIADQENAEKAVTFFIDFNSKRS
ncbi:hypothetical protein AADZ91_16545 [Colwelliaceae bacterium 6441]